MEGVAFDEAVEAGQITRAEARELNKRQETAGKKYGRELSLYNHEASMANLTTLL